MIAKRPRPVLSKLVPCHLDLKGDNLFDDGHRLWLIDWEYAGMSDPLFDLAMLAPTEDFSEAEIISVLEIYRSQSTSNDQLRLKQFTILANLRIALWCLIMAKISPLDCPYQEWAKDLFAKIDLQYQSFQ